jgi:hypothetical protein
MTTGPEEAEEPLRRRSCEPSVTGHWDVGEGTGVPVLAGVDAGVPVLLMEGARPAAREAVREAVAEREGVKEGGSEGSTV